jgi:type IV pilus assembly protein PilQ
MRIIVVIFYVLFQSLSAVAQNRFDRIEELRERLEFESTDIPRLHHKVSVTISAVSLNEFLRGVAIENKLNMSIDPSLDTPVSLNFSDIEILDLLVYVCKQYNAEIILTGKNILTITKFYAPRVESPTILPKEVKISYDSTTKSISYDLRNDTLGNVIRRIAFLTKYNIIAPQKIQNTLVSGYVQNLELGKGLSELAHMNALQFSSRDSAVYNFEELSSKPLQDAQKVPAIVNGLKVLTNSKDSIISIYANNLPIREVLANVTSRLNVNYFLMAELKGNVDVRLDLIDFNSFLRYLFNGTDYTYRYSNGIYLIGERKQEAIRTSDVYKLMNRTTVKILEAIPGELKKGIELIPLADLNSIIISGSAPAVGEVENFLRQIDKSVPVINIEMTILDVSKSRDISTGISAGIDNNGPVKSSYANVFPEIDMKMGANTVNSILNAINGTGMVNLGNVNSNFYLSLRASEDNGLIKILSTPRLAALNGTEAVMTIGETRYYAETSSNIIATQSTTTTNAIVFKPLHADLTITVKPIVSGDEQITMDVTVDQGTFTTQIANNGPFGQTTRTFKSSIRVKNNDIILLGGLEQKSKSNSGRGLPVLSNIPVLKWLFSSRDNKNAKSKLAILIHPTVIY